MAFSKSFPKQQGGSTLWEEVSLSLEEEQAVEEQCRRENIKILHESLEDAKHLAIKHGINTGENHAQLAMALFEKRASHVIFWKEKKVKEKFKQERG